MKPRGHLSGMSLLTAWTKARALVAASLLITGLGASGCAGNADMSEPMASDPPALSSQPAPQAGEGAATLRMKGIVLTLKQTEALKKAYADTPYLSTEQAMEVVRAVDNSLPLNSPQSSGSDSSTGDCSYIDLWGDSDGNYNF